MLCHDLEGLLSHYLRVEFRENARRQNVRVEHQNTGLIDFFWRGEGGQTPPLNRLVFQQP